MKKNDKLKELTLEELQTKYNKEKGAVIGLGIAMLGALVMLIYFVIKNKNYSFLTFIFVLPMTLLPVFISLGQLKTEIKSRNSQS
jgi:lipid-A-disaccharide synthase-like uncharacterized protein